jgi:outer membrane protein OmpA-like peptidoglycan-associated protein
MRITLLAAILPCSLLLQAQQLDTTKSWVVNGDFEKVDTKKLKRSGAIDLAAGWGSPTGAQADIFSDAAPRASSVSIPTNLAGDQMALSGSSYAGIRAWSYNNQEPRTYIQTQLKRRMKKDSLYCIRFYTSLGDLSKYAVSELGVHVGVMKVVKKEEASLTFDISVPAVRQTVHKDMSGWEGVCGVYQAKGSEHFVVIGNYSATEKTMNEKVKRPKGESRPQVPAAYYYIDNVEVFPIADRSACKCDQLKDSESDLIFSRKGVMNPQWNAPQRVDAQVFYYRRFQRLLDPSMEQFLSDLVNDLKADPAIKVRLVGHIDATELGRSRVRPDLAELGTQRAEALRDALVEAGIESTRVMVVGKAADMAADSTGTELGMSKNRRVEVELQ